MSGNNKRPLVPRLRFPEFREGGEWESEQLDQLISTITPPKKIQTTDYLREGQFPIIDQGQSDIAGWTNDAESLIDNHQVLIVFGDHTCSLKLLQRAFAQGADGIKILKGNALVSTDYLYQFLHFRPVIQEEYKRHFAILKAKVVAYPERQSGEQQKIADCLTSLDDLITAQSQKIDKLKAHKKGLMQQLFPAEGEIVPRLRFPEFREAEEWESAQLDQLISTITPPKKIQTTDYLREGQFPIIDQGQNDIAGWTNDAESLIDNHQALIVFGDHTCSLKLLLRTFAQGADGIKIFKGNALVSTDYLYQFLHFRPVIQEEYKRHFAILKAKVVAYPERQSGEQQKIADCLSSLDDLITVHAQKIELLKRHKKGLMQQLFPVLDETPA